MKKYLHLFFALLPVLMMNGCKSDSVSSTFTSQLVVSAYLLANQPIDSVQIMQTQPLDQTYLFPSAAVSGASVTITVDTTVLHLTEYASHKGLYHYVGQHIVTSGKTYQLRVESQGRIVTAQTTVPDVIHYVQNGTNINLNGTDTITYLIPNGEAFLAWTPWAKGIYVASFCSIDSSHAIIARRNNNNDNTPSRISMVAFDKETSAKVPWTEFNYYGLYSLNVYAADAAFYNYALTSEQDQQSLIEPLYNVSGGLGVFGSASKASVTVFVKQ
jgi:hypothetical protein